MGPVDGFGQTQGEGRPLVDGLTVGAGVSMYFGDLDGNPENDAVKHLADGQLGLMLTADRRFGWFTGGVELHYDRIHVERYKLEVSNNLISLDLVGGSHFDIIQPGLFAIMAGAGFTYLMTDYPKLPENLEGFRFEDRGSQLLLTIPVSLKIQDRFQLGVRLTFTDYLDGVEGATAGTDYIWFIKLGHRFSFLN